MLAAFRVTWFTLRALWSDMFILVGGSVLWFLLSLPLWLLSALLGLTLAGTLGTGLGVEVPDVIAMGLFVLAAVLGPGPAAAALGHLTARIAHEDLFEFGLFWQGLRRHWRRALALWLIGQVGLALIVANMAFYLTSGEAAIRLIGAAFGWVLLYWLAVHTLLTPLQIEQAHRPVLTVLRNACVLTVAHPLLFLTLFVLALARTGLAVAITLLAPLLLGSFLSLLGARAVAELKWRYFPEEAPKPADELEGA